MKLVRDKIPQIIRKSGKYPVVTQVSGDFYKHMLARKVAEELEEFMQTPCAEEAGDILEVLYALFESYEISMKKAEKESIIKKEARGGFTCGLVLHAVE